MIAEKIVLTLMHADGSSRPCEVMGVANKVQKRGRGSSATSIRVRFGLAGIYVVNPHTGRVEQLAAWSASPAECERVIAAWKAAP